MGVDMFRLCIKDLTSEFPHNQHINYTNMRTYYLLKKNQEKGKYINTRIVKIIYSFIKN